MRVVDQIIEYARERGLLSADDLERLTAAGFVGRAPQPAGRPVDGRWTERHWERFAYDVEGEEDIERDPATSADPADAELAPRSSKSGRRGQAERRGRRWQSRRARRVRRRLARAWRQPGRREDKKSA